MVEKVSPLCASSMHTVKIFSKSQLHRELSLFFSSFSIHFSPLKNTGYLRVYEHDYLAKIIEIY